MTDNLSAPIRRTTLPVFLALLIAVAFAGAADAADRDKDGLRDSWESRYGVTSPGKRDTDGDGVIDSAEDDDHDRLANHGEMRFGTDPGLRDTDGDGTPDGREDKNGDGILNMFQQDRRRVPKNLEPSLRNAYNDFASTAKWCGVGPASSKLNICRFGKASSAKTIVLMGDSKAQQWLPAVRMTAKARGWRMITLIKGACVPYLGITNATQQGIDGGKTCRSWRDKAIAWLKQHPPKLIVISHSNRYGLVDGRGRSIVKSKRPQAWVTGLRRTLNALPGSSEVLVLGDNQRYKNNPVSCLRRHLWNMSACSMRKETKAQRPVEQALAAAAAANGATFRPINGQVCTYDPCPLVHHNILIYRNHGHLTKTFARRLQPTIRALLLEALAK